MPLQRRLPKRGFRPRGRVPFLVVNVSSLGAFPAGSTVGPEELRAKGLAHGKGPIKCLANGTLEVALTVKAHAFSERARQMIVAAGGTAEIVGA